jgi:hypothetical protein
MKTRRISDRKIFISFVLLLIAHFGIGQTIFKEKELTVSKQNDDRLKKSFKVCKSGSSFIIMFSVGDYSDK